MNKTEVIGVILFLLATVGVVVAVLSFNQTPTTEILARAPEKGNFTPRKVVVPVGQEVKLRIRNVDTVSHGFAIPDLAVDVGEIKAGHIVNVKFTPQKVGTYNFYCTRWCSEFHLQMRGVIEVIKKTDPQH